MFRSVLNANSPTPSRPTTTFARTAALSGSFTRASLLDILLCGGLSANGNTLVLQAGIEGSIPSGSI
jgi:hypothetical protein